MSSTYEIERATALLEKCSAMSLLCSKATTYWNFIKICFQMPLILTSSTMCILNSFDDNKGNMKIPNVIVNGLSVLLLAIQSNLKVIEKVETFKNLSNQFRSLANSIEGCQVFDNTQVNNFNEKYDILIQQCEFESILEKHKNEVSKAFQGKTLPLQLNNSGTFNLKLNAQLINNNNNNNTLNLSTQNILNDINNPSV
jgi:hypothetical protein